MYMQKEWTPQDGMIPALSVQQPFTMALVTGKKDIEIRTWGTHYKGQILLHAGKLWDGQCSAREDDLRNALLMAKRFVRRLDLSREVADYALGALVGIAQLVKCAKFSEDGWYNLEEHHQHDGYWDPDRWGWQFENMRRFVEPVPYRGQLGLFGVEEVLVREQIANAIEVPFTVVPRQTSPEDRDRPMSIADTRRMLGRQRAAGYWPAEIEDIG